MIKYVVIVILIIFIFGAIQNALYTKEVIWAHVVILCTSIFGIWCAINIH